MFVHAQNSNADSVSYTLESLSTSWGSRTAAKQLQALHTENLQLKALLKKEVEARQQLQQKHTALLELLRYVLED